MMMKMKTTMKSFREVDPDCRFCFRGKLDTTKATLFCEIPFGPLYNRDRNVDLGVGFVSLEGNVLHA